MFLANHRTPLVLDEIQYAPELVASIKRRVDQDRRSGQYLITGISAFRKTYPGLRIEKGLVIAPVPAIQQLSEEDYTIPWDLDGKGSYGCGTAAPGTAAPGTDLQISRCTEPP